MTLSFFSFFAVWVFPIGQFNRSVVSEERGSEPLGIIARCGKAVCDDLNLEAGKVPNIDYSHAF